MTVTARPLKIRAAEPQSRPHSARTSGIVIHTPRRFDLIVALAFLGRERAFRNRLADLAGLSPGETVLDVACGTGTLAILAKQRVGESGRVRAIDASVEMISRARKKARRANVDVAFENAFAEALPFADKTFDVVTSTFLLRHLPPEARDRTVREMCRVVKPDGRLLLVDTRPTPAQLRAAAGNARQPVDVFDSIPTIRAAGFDAITTGAVGFRNLHFILATAPALKGQVS
jgi:2-polyprenyl-3-methyl-5-hydroxy-6-metoxy-1,4-benzoquinol methylase